MKKSYKDMTKAELIAQRDKMAKDLLNLRMEKVLGYLDNPISVRTTRRNIARLNTRIHAIEIGIDK
ncbi:MAG: 50S ribosomal protein L29 [Spirochaetales bacterium]|nr:50S ribosomal protein L29 [Spirochaetales bacterium]